MEGYKDNKEKEPKFPEIAEEIKRMVEEDQEMRQRNGEDPEY
jgi:hypothetical protein